MSGLQNANTGKLCTNCNEEINELFDSYMNSCPECSNESTKVLVNSKGVWIWE
jgi:Zn finger protein HypA/HybF involved in hydrogenase expression